jgi:hypothetical protein
MPDERELFVQERLQEILRLFHDLSDEERDRVLSTIAKFLRVTID